tara:strand:+ start:436 stop:570 length:135 start_codon:yes stop_codon:yes gene_type:complete
MFIIGDREIESNKIGVRLRSGDDLGALGLDDVMNHINNSIDDKI